MPIARPKPKNYELDLSPDEKKRQRELRKQIADAFPKPARLAEIQSRLKLSFDDMALAIDATDRSHAWRLCNMTRRPHWPYACHIVKVLGGATSIEKVMG